jgi:prepilin signal peptidase PulO-like enzyme (type II secretory pathway)
MMFSSFEDTMFTLAPIFIGIVTIIVFGTIIFTALKGVGTWSSNNNTPTLKVPAEVVAKRSRTYGGSHNTSTSTSYYATFQVESGDRMELAVKGSEFGLLAEGDLGILTFQGTRSHRFERVTSE